MNHRLCLAILALSGIAASAFGFNFLGTPDAEVLVEEFSDEQLLGQTILIGYLGDTPGPDLFRWITERSVGGVKLYGWNGNNLTRLVEAVGAMQSASLESSFGIPLFIATDQEGGWVRHIRGNTSVTPGNMALGASGRLADAYETGRRIGEELAALGINMNFAPTVDVYLNPDAHVIGPRSFGDDPVSASNLGVAYYRGMASTGVVATAKHFPGHGRAAGDSHGILPVVDAGLEELWDTDLLPYRYLFKEGIEAVMVGHIAFPNLTGDSMPASLSPFVGTELLRERMGYEGLLIADDLNMNGVRESGLSDPEIAVAAYEAGNDMLLFSGTPSQHDGTWDALLAEMRQNAAFRDRIKQAATRVIRLKLKDLKDGPIPLAPSAAPIRALGAANSTFFFEQACLAASPLGTGSTAITKEGSILLVGQVNAFFREGLARIPEAKIYDFPYDPFYASRELDRRMVADLADQFDVIVFGLLNPNGLEVLRELERHADKLWVLSALTPVYLTELPWVKQGVAVYGVGFQSFRAGFAALMGDFEPGGEIPLTWEPAE
jgi:beta-N-acetylhexosaminidase